MEFRTSRQCIIMGKVESSTKAKGEDMSSLCMRKFSLSVQREGKKNKMLTTRAKRVNIITTGPAIDHAPGKQSISLEPGGQFELSGMPLKTLHQTCDEINSHLYQAKTVAEEMGIGFLGLGFQPKWRLEDIPGVPKVRYNIMQNHLHKFGPPAIESLFMTCSVQVNLDFSSEADMIKKMRASIALQPNLNQLAAALFANSPFKEGVPNGYLTIRSHRVGQIHKRRVGILPFVFYDTFGFEQYVDYALDVPMLFVYRKNKYIDCRGMSFRDFMASKLPAIPGQVPTLGDWENHLITIFPEVRLKRYMEMRGADDGPLEMLCALPAFWVIDLSMHNIIQY
ncbi:Glutamate--cysteine ligase, chloroplastic [Glycine max]|nr:Glutamate--cysteine ligase, chloroplastic [Glycine max]